MLQMCAGDASDILSESKVYLKHSGTQFEVILKLAG
jgi:hypothetical protein